jgi:guanylate kinase
MNKLLIVTAPSGSGKTTIVRHLLRHFPQLAFSVSATNRLPRKKEKEGRDYYFLTDEVFQKKIRENEFLEWEEVYPGRYYGTLRSEIEKLWSEGKTVVFDIDTQGASNLKDLFPDQSLSLFIRPPSLKALEARLRKRQTESEEDLQMRLAKAKTEMEQAANFDQILINDELEEALREAERLVGPFLSEE